MTTYRPLKVAIVGCGAVSKLYYMPALQELERLGQVHVSALFDPNIVNLAPIHRAFPSAVPARDLDELTRLGVDLAIVASPPQYHATQTIQLLQAGLAVLCEKPMALSVEEVQAMVAAASRTGQLLAIGLVRRFLPAAEVIGTILSRNMLGNVKSFTCHEGRVFRWPVQSASYFHSNGVLRDIGVHALDLLLWWWGEPEQIFYEDDAMGGVELNCRVRLRFPQGFTGEVRLSREFRLSNSYVISCENGQIFWDLDETNELQIKLHGAAYSLHTQLHSMNDADPGLSGSGPAASDFHRCFLNQLKNVIAAVHGTEVLKIPGPAGLASLRAIEHCYSQRALMHMPWLEDQEIWRARQLGKALPR